jgi:hypothetical protein
MIGRNEREHFKTRRFLWLSSNFNNDWPIGVSAKVKGLWRTSSCLGIIKFLKPMPNDKPTDPETPRNKDLKYDREKRTRTFQNSWIDKFPWVVFVENAQEMYCKYCRKFSHFSRRFLWLSSNFNNDWPMVCQQRPVKGRQLPGDHQVP